MLIAKPPMLCQRCHNHSRHPATVYDVSQLNNRSNKMVWTRLRQLPRGHPRQQSPGRRHAASLGGHDHDDTHTCRRPVRRPAFDGAAAGPDSRHARCAGSRAATRRAGHAGAAPAPAADEPTGAPLDVNLRSVDFGVRITDVSGDEARYNRYQDKRTGPVVQGFRYTSENQDRLWRAEADNIGYRDQRYSANFEQFGRFKGWFEYNQIPYEQDYSPRTPYTLSGSVATVDDALQTSIQNGTATLNPAVEALCRAVRTAYQARHHDVRRAVRAGPEH